MHEAYIDISSGGEVYIDISVDEEAAILAAHDHGIENLNDDDYRLLQSAIRKIKNFIWEFED